MICQHCQKNPATVHVTELQDPGDSESSNGDAICEQHVCEVCAQTLDLPHASVPTKTMADIWKLLQVSAQKARTKTHTVSCPDCKMTLEEVRSRGRLGCPKDYEVFGDYLQELLERMHGSTEHVGRVPGIDEVELQRLQKVSNLKQELETAVAEEAYERAASLRDEINTLEPSLDLETGEQ